jgi:hypothetical protein
MNLAEKVADWASRENSVEAVVLIGSQVRSSEDAVWRADAQSDWDFQIISSNPALFANGSWTEALGVATRAYAVRQAAIGGVPKIAVLFAATEADFVILPTTQLLALREAVGRGEHQGSAPLRRTLQDLAIVIRPGWRFLKGAGKWEAFYEQVVADIVDPRLSDDEVRNIANSFACDQVWTLRKIDRGELIAAQRMLHRALAETNFRLLHELKLRRGERTFPEARRIERVGSEAEVTALTVNAAPEAGSLRAAVEKISATCRELVRALIGDSWSWPKL